MEQIIRTYGVFLLETVAILFMLILLFYGITDEGGNRGVLRMIGHYLEGEQEEIPAGHDFAVFQEEGGKASPQIVCELGQALDVGMYRMDTYIKAIDSSGREIPIKITNVFNEQGDDVTLNETNNMEVFFNKAGIYTIWVTAMDESNKISRSQVRIPVNE